MNQAPQSNPKRIMPDDLADFCIAAMRRCGMSAADAQITADVLVTTDLWGIHTHGVVSLRQYLRRVQAGGLAARAEPEIVAEGAGWACLDGKGAMGMVSSHRAMTLAMAKARGAGIGYVALRGGSHFGAAGYYANMAAEEDMIGLAMSGCTPVMAAPGGKTGVIGNNPIAFAAPAGEERTILLDIALSKVAAGKIVAARAAGRPIPDDWYVDGDGMPTTDPSLYPDVGALLPAAGHKGYGLAIMVEVLTAVLSGGGILQGVKPWYRGEPSEPEGLSQGMMAIHIGSFMPIDAFKQRIDHMIREIRSSPKARDSTRIYLPGEIEWERCEEAKANGIALPEDILESLRGVAEDLGLESLV